jgi:hypothetical protein
MTFDRGLAQACAVAAGKDPAKVSNWFITIKSFDFGKREAFPYASTAFFLFG